MFRKANHQKQITGRISSKRSTRKTKAISFLIERQIANHYWQDCPSFEEHLILKENDREMTWAFQDCIECMICNFRKYTTTALQFEETPKGFATDGSHKQKSYDLYNTKSQNRSKKDVSEWQGKIQSSQLTLHKQSRISVDQGNPICSDPIPEKQNKGRRLEKRSNF